MGNKNIRAQDSQDFSHAKGKAHFTNQDLILAVIMMKLDQCCLHKAQSALIGHTSAKQCIIPNRGTDRGVTQSYLCVLQLHFRYTLFFQPFLTICYFSLSFLHHFFFSLSFLSQSFHGSLFCLLQVLWFTMSILEDEVKKHKFPPFLKGRYQEFGATQQFQMTILHYYSDYASFLLSLTSPV